MNSDFLRVGGFTLCAMALSHLCSYSVVVWLGTARILPTRDGRAFLYSSLWHRLRKMPAAVTSHTPTYVHSRLPPPALFQALSRPALWGRPQSKVTRM